MQGFLRLERVRAPDAGEDMEIRWADAGHGAPVLLVHGGHGGLVHWQANIEHLAHKHRIVAPDMPGFGGSSDPGRCFTPEEHASVLAGWLDHLQLTDVTVVGFSFGSLVALELAQRGRARALMLVNPPGVGPRSPEALALPERMSAVARQSGRRAAIHANLDELMLSQKHLITDALVDQMLVAAQETRYVTRSMSRASQTLQVLDGLDIPVGVLIGEQDPFHSNDLAGRRSAIDAVLEPGATRFVAGAAHWLQYDQPQVFAAELDEFLQKTKETA